MKSHMVKWIGRNRNTLIIMALLVDLLSPVTGSHSQMTEIPSIVLRMKSKEYQILVDPRLNCGSCAALCFLCSVTMWLGAPISLVPIRLIRLSVKMSIKCSDKIYRKVSATTSENKCLTRLCLLSWDLFITQVLLSGNECWDAAERSYLPLHLGCFRKSVGKGMVLECLRDTGIYVQRWCWRR